MRGSTKPIRTADSRLRIGIVVDAGPQIGYGHAVRCLRLASRLESVDFYPLSEACAQFLRTTGSQFAIRSLQSPFPPVVVTDLRETHGITAEIQRQGALHISIHDLGLGQCCSHIAIDGSVVRLFPFQKVRTQTLFLGPSYMITRPPIPRRITEEFVFLTLGGGLSAEFAPKVREILNPLGLKVVTTHGFGRGGATPDEEITRAIATCRFAISTAGTSLYDLLASGVPTIAVSVDRLQQRTADAFHEMGAVLSAGLISRLSPQTIKGQIAEIVGNGALVERMVAAGRTLVDGKGLSRVVEILTNASKEMQYV